MTERSQKPWLAIVLALIAGLGGGGLGVQVFNRFFPDNKPPIAVAQVFPAGGEEPNAFVFNGVDSEDPEGKALSFRWKLDGQAVGPQREVMTLSIDEVGSHVVQLQVIDDGGLMSEISTVIDVKRPPQLLDFDATQRAVRKLIDVAETKVALFLVGHWQKRCADTLIAHCHRVWRMSADVHMARADEDGARKAFANAMELAPKRPSYVVDYGKFLIAQDRYTDAVDLFEEKRDVFNGSAPIAYYLALAQIAVGDFQDAEQGFLLVSEQTHSAEMLPELGAFIALALQKRAQWRSQENVQRVRNLVCAFPVLRAFVGRTAPDATAGADTEIDRIFAMAKRHVEEDDLGWLMATMEQNECA